MRILYTGPLSPGQTCEMRRKALERLGHQTLPVDYMPFVEQFTGMARKIQWHLRVGPLVAEYNRVLAARVESGVDLIWVDKGMFVRPDVVRRAKERGARWAVHYSPDNYFLRQNNSRYFLRALALYDLVVTTKSANLERLKASGARAVFLSGNAYDPEVHRPVSVPASERDEYDCDVSFIGRWEPEREEWLDRVSRLSVRLMIRGTGWQRAKAARVRSAWRGKEAVGDEYTKAICGARINLAFLSRLADDDITQRSVEIPACGAFMLAERTAAHLAHFEEALEAAFYSGEEEMCDKIMYYLNHEKERQAVAVAGRQRCLRSGYSYDLRLEEILRTLVAPVDHVHLHE